MDHRTARVAQDDYEHHRMGKAELNLMDPAYDMAETILNLTLSPEEESRLIRRYIEESGDASVEQRLFMNKLREGLWAMDSAQEHLFGKSQAAHRQQEIHERFISAWNFLTVHAARFATVIVGRRKNCAGARGGGLGSYHAVECPSILRRPEHCPLSCRSEGLLPGLFIGWRRG